MLNEYRFKLGLQVLKNIDTIVRHLLKPISVKKQSNLSTWVRETLSVLLNVLSSLIISITGILDAVVCIPIWLYSLLHSKSGNSIYQLYTIILSSILGGMISVAGHLTYCLGILIRFVNTGRSLTENEKEIIFLVFQQSVNTENIRIIQLPFWNNYYFVLHNYIFTPYNIKSISNSLLIHEVVHIWQFHQQGCSYIYDALAAQIHYGRKCFAGNAYDWTAEVKRGKRAWEDFNKEAAAQFIEEIWNEGTCCDYSIDEEKKIIEAGNGIFFRVLNESTYLNNNAMPTFISNRDSQDYSELAIQAINKIRSRK